MQSQRQIIRKYNALFKDIENKIDNTNRVNCYVCSCGHITKTIDVDPGVTPFMCMCEKCNNMAKSSFYKDIAPEQQPTEEWYRPTLKQVLKMKNDQAMLDHILKGGLALRKVSQIAAQIETKTS